ncbi:MAG: hypothetical protein K2X01_06865 [Cyanobacteria bacterium]|nr:hypothetical protein [Cyanobacteriota bacterium]
MNYAPNYAQFGAGYGNNSNTFAMNPYARFGNFGGGMPQNTNEGLFQLLNALFSSTGRPVNGYHRHSRPKPAAPAPVVTPAPTVTPAPAVTTPPSGTIKPNNELTPWHVWALSQANTWINSADTNHDGRIQRDEYATQWAQHTGGTIDGGRTAFEHLNQDHKPDAGLREIATAFLAYQRSGLSAVQFNTALGNNNANIVQSVADAYDSFGG